MVMKLVSSIVRCSSSHRNNEETEAIVPATDSSRRVGMLKRRRTKSIGCESRSELRTWARFFSWTSHTAGPSFFAFGFLACNLYKQETRRPCGILKASSVENRDILTTPPRFQLVRQDAQEKEEVSEVGENTNEKDAFCFSFFCKPSYWPSEA